MPELQKSEIRLSIHGGSITIQGERRAATEKAGTRVRHAERSFGVFARSFALPDDARPSRLAADVRDGVLYVRVPRAQA